MDKRKKEVLKSIAEKIKDISVEDARYIQGYIEAKTEMAREAKKTA